MKIRIGTRGSRLALVQTEMLVSAIHKKFPEIETEIVRIKTEGDRVIDRPLSVIGGKGVFVSEIEYALQCGEIDVAVHSAKDLPVQLGENLEISGVLPRGDYRDVLVTAVDRDISADNYYLIGTGSLRRRRNMKRIFPNAEFSEIRGNIDTRLRQVTNGTLDGVILAAAGLERLGTEGFKFTFFDSDEFIPAACQGIIAVECRTGNRAIEIIREVSDENTMICFETEREILRLLDGGCNIPAAAFSEINDGKIRVTATADSIKFVSGESEISRRIDLVEELVSRL
jgi:hydroxymethylbilane synthase/uroporphyrinogen III methyltransferase/synthase